MAWSTAGAAALWEEAAARRWLAAELARVFASWGYRELVTPVTMPWEDVTAGLTGLGEQACKLLAADGGVLALRPDNTLPIARMAAADLALEPRPLRIFYTGDVYRRAGDAFRRPGGAGCVSSPQAGVELVGAAGPQADAEVLALAAESLLALGLDDFRIAVGHVGLLGEILAAAGVDGALRLAVLEALQNRDHVALEAALEAAPGLDGAGREALVRLLTMPAPWAEVRRITGGQGAGQAAREEPVPRSPSVGRLPGAEGGWRDVARILSLLAAYGLEGSVVLEPGLVRDLGYYTGMVFEISCPGLARPLGGGGRYDGLLAQFGAAEPATGFAFELTELLRALAARDLIPRLTVPPRWLVAAEPGCEAAAWERARALRREGAAVELEVAGGTVEKTLEYARRRGVKRVLLCGSGGEREIPAEPGEGEAGPGEGEVRPGHRPGEGEAGPGQGEAGPGEREAAAGRGEREAAP